MSCECGCGDAPAIARWTNARLGHVKGQPVRFIAGHQNRHFLVPPTTEDRGYRTECLVWQRGFNQKGYGLINGRGAHRVLWEKEHEAIPDGYELDHLCRVRSCVNLDHLEVVTHAENVRRAGHLTEELVREIRSSSKTGRALARQLGVAPTTISAIRCGKTWADV